MSDPTQAIARVRTILLDVWRDLTDGQRSALRRATISDGGRELESKTNRRTARSLAAKKLLEPSAGTSGSLDLSPLGLLVREVGLEADAAAARRRYSRRAQTQEARPA